MDYMRNMPEWLKTLFCLFFAKELTRGEWVKLYLTQILEYICQTTSKAFLDTWAFASTSTSLVTCIVTLTIISATCYGTLVIIRGRHRTHNSPPQTTSTTNTNTTPTNIISLQSAVQYGQTPCMPNSSTVGATLENYHTGTNLQVWWAKQKLRLKGIPRNEWASRTVMLIEDRVLEKLGGDIARYDETEDGFDQLRTDLEALQQQKTPVHLNLYGLTNRKQLKNESLAQFGKAIRDLANRTGKIEEKELQNVFCRGLSNSELRRDVTRNVFQQQPANLEAVIEYASSTDEAWRNAKEVSPDETLSDGERPRQSVVRFQPPSQRQQGQYQQQNPRHAQTQDTRMTQQTQAAPTTSHSSPPQHPPHNRNFPNLVQKPYSKSYEALPRDNQAQCYGCHEYGHTQRHCPNPSNPNL